MKVKRTMEQNSLSERVELVLNKYFSVIALSEETADVIRRALFFWIQSSAEPVRVPFNILLSSGDVRRTEHLLQGFAKALAELTENCCRVHRIGVETFLTEGLNSASCSEGDVICIGPYSELNGERWSAAFDVVRKHPEISFVLYVENDVSAQRLRENADIYYRLFALHLSLPPMSAQDCCAAFLQLLCTHYVPSEAFILGITQYIRVVYPTADLRDTLFVEDLLRRVITSRLSKPVSGNTIDVDCVPYRDVTKDYEKLLAAGDLEALEIGKTSADKALLIDMESPFEFVDENLFGENLADKDSSKDVTSDLLEEAVLEEAPAKEKLANLGADQANEISHEEELNPKPQTEPSPGTEIGSMVQTGKPVNILMMSLSTFQKSKDNKNECVLSPRVYSYQFGEDSGTVVGYYQLDPLPRYLSEKKVPIDYCVLVATKETRETCELYADDCADVISPLAYFSKHLNEWLGLDIDNPDIVHVIDLDLGRPELAVYETAEFLKGVSVANPNVTLYVDGHGGFRDINLLFSAIITLLGRDKIKVKPYNVRFDENKPELLEDSTLRIFDFVSGINEFTNYGRINSLHRFLKERENENKDLINPIKELSDGILACNVKTFDQGIRNLRIYYSGKQKKEIHDSYLKIFEDSIHADYGSLLDSCVSTKNKVEWCLNKGFYQQAFTLLESHIAQDLLDQGILFNCYGADSEYVSWYEIFNGCIYSFSKSHWCWDMEKPISTWSPSRKENAELMNRLFIDDNSSEYKANCISVKIGKETGKCTPDYLKNRFKNLPLAYLNDFLTSSISLPKGDAQQNKRNFLINYPVVAGSHLLQNAVKINLQSDLSKRYFLLFISLHKSLKNMRNNFNHADDSAPYTLTIIENFLRYYLFVLEKIGVK